MNPSDKDIINRMIALADNHYNCSQIMLILAMDRAGQKNPDMVRAMAGLGDGCGFFKETCGIMTSASCILGWYGAKGSDREVESSHFLPMLQEMGDWFEQKILAEFKGTRCKDIVGDQAGTESGKIICGGLIYQTYEKLDDILTSYGF